MIQALVTAAPAIFILFVAAGTICGGLLLWLKYGTRG